MTFNRMVMAIALGEVFLGALCSRDGPGPLRGSTPGNSDNLNRGLVRTVDNSLGKQDAVLAMYSH